MKIKKRQIRKYFIEKYSRYKYIALPKIIIIFRKKIKNAEIRMTI